MTSRLITFAESQKLPYLQAVIKGVSVWDI